MYVSFLFTQGLIPLGLLLWQGLSRSQNQLGWLLKTVVVATALGATSLAGLWSVFFPWWTPYLYWVVWGVLTIVTWHQVKQQPRWPKRTIWGFSRVMLCGGFAGLLGVLTLQAAMGYLPPAIEPVSLTFPLRDGNYYVLNGGNQALVNSHVKTLEKRFRNYQGQSYGVDIVKLNRWGVRAPGLLPKEIERYEIFGEPVYAPCDGTVIASENQMPDMVPPQPDRDHLLGNFVLLRCDEADVLLAHFKQGGVAVATGESLTVGQPLGEIGNSGNTNEPHLHIHAQHPGSKATPIDGDPLPIVFGDRYLVRNARITDNSAKATSMQ